MYYSDTDSLVTNIALPDKLVSSNKLGFLKLEHDIVEGIFITNKIYYLLDKKGAIHIRAKGVDSSSLNYEKFLNLLKYRNISENDS